MDVNKGEVVTGKNQQSGQDELRAAMAIMIRAIILAAVVALVVSAAPLAWAGTSKAKAPRFERAERATAFVWEAELSPVVTRKVHLEYISIGAGKDRGWQLASLGAADDVSTLKARPSGAVVVLIGANDYGVVARRP